MKQLIASIFALLLSVTAICQVAAPTVSQSSSTSTSTALTRPTWVAMHVGGGFQLNAGGWRERYNANAKFDLGAEYQHKEQWLVGFNYVPYTGGWVNTDSLYGDIISNANYLFDVNGNPAVIRTYMRGFNFCATGGKIIPLKQSTLKNPRTWSLQLIGGLGYHEHFTKFQFDKGLVPQLEGFYEVGHDNYRAGYCFTEQVRLQYMNPNTLSFQVGLGLIQGVTKNMREWDMSTFRAPDARQTDFGFGINCNLVIPIIIYTKNAVRETEYFE
jgi:hypothetical protein